jgi:hypothetical protein
MADRSRDSFTGNLPCCLPVVVLRTFGLAAPATFCLQVELSISTALQSTQQNLDTFNPAHFVA